MSKTIVEFKDIVKTYGSGDALLYAVNHIDFKIEEGEFVVILGQSGAGKSTVLNIVCLTPTVSRELSECTVNRISEEGIYYEV